MSIGYLLVGHGTRHSQGQEEFLYLAEQVRTLVERIPLEPAFLELAEPTIETAISRLRAHAVTEVRCAPVILLAAAHVKRDIPATVRSAAEKQAIERITFVEHLGCQQTMLELSLRRYHQALTSTPAGRPAGWVLVGRGTHDADALAEIRRFQALREEIEPTSQHWLGFLAMAEPTLTDALSLAAQSAAETIVVQPHLLFQGDLLIRTAELAAEFANRYPAKQWLLSEHLGPDATLAELLAAELKSPNTPLVGKRP